jgi:hypothetical protein
MLMIKTNGMTDALDMLSDVADNLPVQLNIALSKAGDKVRKEARKEISKHVNLPEKRAKRLVGRKNYRERVETRVFLKLDEKVALWRFNPKQEAKGVLVTFTKAGDSVFYESAFLVRKWGNKPYHKPLKGSRIIKVVPAENLYPYIAHHSAVINRTLTYANEIVRKEIAERVRFLTLKKAGKLSWQNK